MHVLLISSLWDANARTWTRLVDKGRECRKSAQADHFNKETLRHRERGLLVRSRGEALAQPLCQPSEFMPGDGGDGGRVQMYLLTKSAGE